MVARDVLPWAHIAIPSVPVESEVVATLQVVRERGFLYFLRGADVWRISRPDPDGRRKEPTLVATSGIDVQDGHDASFLYFLDPDGNIARARRKDAPSTP